MKTIIKDLEFILKKIFLNEKKLLKKRILRSIKGGYEKEIKVLSELVNKKSDSIDVGVYRGVYSYELARLSNHTHSFEANPIIYKYLKKNLIQLIDNMTLYDYALSNHNGEAKLRIPIRRKTIFKDQFEEKYHAGLSTIHDQNTFDSYNEFDEFTVSTKKVDDLKFINRIGFIKIDVEGHELKIIDGAKETIKKHKPNLLIEIEEKHSKKKLNESINYIKALKYDVYIYKHNKLIKIEDFQIIKNEINFIFKPM